MVPSKTIEERFKKLTPKEHILKKPGMYIGNIYTEPTKLFVFEDINDLKSNKFAYKVVDYNAGFCKLYDEVLTNASDHYIRTGKVKYIKIDVERDHIVIENDGPGIPIEMHKEHNIYVPELIFGNLLSGENFDENEKRMVGGTHGLGVKLSNIFSTKFIIETADGKNKYKQTFINNMDKKTKPEISKSNRNYTRITFYPDFKKFDMVEISDDVQSILLKRAIDIAAYNPDVKVYYNKTLIPIKTFKDYVKMFLTDDEELFYERLNDNWEVCVAKSQNDMFQQVSMVNGVSTIVGGTHVNFISNQIVRLLGEKIEKTNKGVNVKQNMIKSHLFLFLNCRITNPEFETQSKENLTSKLGNDIINNLELSEAFIKKLATSEIKNDIVNFATIKEFQEAKKQTSQNGQKAKVKINKLDDANKAGKSPDSMRCQLFLTEGDSAASTAKRGRSIIGNDYFGIFPLKGKPMNVRNISLQKMRDDVEIDSIIKALGLEFGKKYNTTRTLRYGKVVIMSDMDTDGSHIKGLIVNLFDTYWPELLELDFVYEFITPLIKIKKGFGASARIKYFYRMKDYKKWKDDNKEGGWFIKYYKGLGTIEPHEAKLFFKDLAKHLIRFNPSAKFADDRNMVDLAFNSKRIEDRKKWLLGYKPTQELDKFTTKQTYESFFNNEFIEFSMADNVRSIPNVMDGLKPSQRKVLYTQFKRNFKDEVKVELFMGSVLEIAAYHHGPASLEQTIIGMAQDFVGSNNINLLDPVGEYGTRSKGGKDASASRYIFTKLNSVTRDIFKSDDDSILEYMVDDGYIVEPKYYVPIIPMVLINGSDGIGTGWSSYVPPCNPNDVITYIENKLKNKKNIKLLPWFKNFKGETIYDNEKQRYVTKGIIEKLDRTKVKITELPIYTWNDSYYLFLDKLIKDGVIRDYDKYCNDSDVNIVVSMAEENLSMMDHNTLIKQFNLESYLSMSNMNLFDTSGKIHLYSDHYEIIDSFIKIRLEAYDARKKYLLDKLEENKKFLINKMKFINLVLKKEVTFENKSKDNIIKQIESNGIEPHKGDFEYLLNISLISLSKERLEELKASFNKVKLEIEKITSTTITDMWLTDLNELKKRLEK